MLAEMAKRTARKDVRARARQLGAPFWSRMQELGFDRFFQERLLRSLLRRFRQDRFARVRQGGQHGDARADLARVFVDLEVEPIGGQEQEPASRIVASWMRNEWRPDFENARFMKLDLFRPMAGLPFQVVLGGPGQGKSTVGRFLVLIHASILLLSSPMEGIATPLDLQQMDVLLAGLQAEGIAFPDVVRLPLWVELRLLMGAIEQQPEDALAAFFQWYASTELAEADDAAALALSLGSLPWLMVADGLDEVPPDESRALVRAMVTGLRSRYSAANAFLIGTSRPQSYASDAFGSEVSERTLKVLTKERALHYAERLAPCVHTDDERERAALVTHLRNALADPASAALMTNPLLVTIMAMIIVHHGKAANRRWTLFKEYYTTLYHRETERNTYASSVLKEHRDLIDAIHAHVGMSLQARAENVGGVSATMPEAELRALVRERLLERFEEEEALRLAAEILRAAEQRLVFLVQAREGQYSFELRSFQEFMAAWQIVRLAEANLITLLGELAALNSWRNVVLFVIGYLFAETSAIREQCSTKLCDALDVREDISGSYWLPGARLALAIVEDGSYGKSTKLREAFLSHALSILQKPGALPLDMATRLWNVDPERVQREVEAMLEDPARKEIGWFWLLFSVRMQPHAQALADRFWPSDAKEQAALLRAHRQAFTALDYVVFGDHWFVERILQTKSIEVVAEDYEMAAGYENTFGAIFCSIADDGPAWFTGNLQQSTHNSNRAYPSIEERDRLAVYDAALALTEGPETEGLALALRLLADAWSERDRWLWPWVVPWPLHTCLLAAQDADNLRQMAQRAEQGQLGSKSLWLKGQAAFDAIPVERFRELALSDDPLHSILVDQLVPPFDFGRSQPVLRYGDNADATHVPALLDAYRIAQTAWVRRMLAQLLLLALGPRKDERSHPALEWKCVFELADVAERPLNLAWFACLAEPPDASALVSAILQSNASLVVSGGFPGSHSLAPLIPALVAQLRTTPDSPRLQHALVLVLVYEIRSARASDIGVLDLHVEGDTLDAWLLRYLAGDSHAYEPSRWIERLLDIEDGNALDSRLRLLFFAPERPARILHALIAHPRASLAQRACATNHLSLPAYGSAELSTATRWQQVGLPAPPPAPLTPPKLLPMSARFASLEIENIRAFAQRFEVRPPETPSEGQWMVFLGENATGKTTLLRAIAMALAGSADAAAIPGNLDGPLRRDPSLDGMVRLKTTDKREFKALVRSADRDEKIDQEGNPPRPWVVGYGCRRGSALSGTDMDNAFVPFRDIDNLFDRPRGVLRASFWLKELQRLAKNNGAQSKLIYESAREALKFMLLDAETISVEDEVYVTFKTGRRVPLALLSDGYLTTAGWVVDLMARWLDRNRAQVSGNESFCRSMTGVVLLDEIDLHLHPKWQERIIEDVRTLFPKLSFIVTTHNPLTLRGARNGEVFVLGQDEETGALSATQRDIPPGTRIDELITGAWFNRPSAIVDAETKALLDEHQRLILSGAKAGSPKRKEIEGKLRERLGRFADTSIERLAATIATQYLEKDLPEPSAEKREEVRARVLAFLDKRDEKREERKAKPKAKRS